ncbi:DUF6173 family protein [Amylibacter sp.]|nr:DUF6173 family protein [Amylibacter sp.]
MSDDFNELRGKLMNTSSILNETISRVRDAGLQPSLSTMTSLDVRNYEHADWMHERIVRSINDFEQELDSESEVGLRLANFEGVGLIYIDDVGYWNPNIIKFYGKTSNGANAELLQHVGQLNFLLLALPKVNEVPKRIGLNCLLS